MTFPHKVLVAAGSNSLDHDIDGVQRLVVRLNASASGSIERAYLAEQIVEQMQMQQWLSELRCLRHRPLAPCPDPRGQIHARDLSAD